MIPLYVDIPSGYNWPKGYQTIFLPEVPRKGDFLVDAGEHRLEVKMVLFRTNPREVDQQPHIELVVK